MIEAKLKACPFCGEKITDHGFQGAPWDRGYYIKCESCGARGPTTDHEDEAVANARWNERAGDRESEAVQNSEAKGQFAPCHGSVQTVPSLCEIRPGIGLCDNCGEPKFPQRYYGAGTMICDDCASRY